jgi:hypothetical protein
LPKNAWSPYLGVGGKSATKLSKIYIVPSVQGKTRPSPFNLTKIGSTLSPEEHRLHEWAGPLVAEHTT